MSEPFFPLKAQQVVPIFKIDDNDEVTRVYTEKTEQLAEGFKLRIIRFALASILKFTIIEIDPSNQKRTYRR